MEANLEVLGMNPTRSKLDHQPQGAKRQISHRKKIPIPTFRTLVLRQSDSTHSVEGLKLETSDLVVDNLFHFPARSFHLIYLIDLVVDNF